jgi:hypothetical protein
MKKMKRTTFLSVLLLTGCCTACNRKPTTPQIQSAIQQVLSQFQRAGNVSVVGLRENSGQNTAEADLQFNGFQYMADGAGRLLDRNYQKPREPNINSPNFYQEMAAYGMASMSSVQTWSGGGLATLTHYSDGRWMLTSVRFGTLNDTGVTCSVLIR